MIDKCLQNQGLFDKETLSEEIPNWFDIIQNFKKVNKQII